jgi:hypothetical protein
MGVVDVKWDGREKTPAVVQQGFLFGFNVLL